jgi:UMP-CMP kinase
MHRSSILTCQSLLRVSRSSIIKQTTRIQPFHCSSRVLKNYKPSQPQPPKTENNNSQGGRPNHFQFLIVLGGLVIASSLVSSFLVTGKMPEPSVDAAPGDNFKSGISVIFVLGGPGAGKGTQCSKMVADYGFVHLSAGDLLREEQKRPGSQYGQLIDEYIKAGKIVPQEVTIGLLDREITNAYQTQGKTRFLVDGFPRKMDQAITFEEQVVPSEFTLFFDCREEVMLQRLLKRGETSGRTDDNIESIKKRFKTFEETSMPVIDYFDHQKKVVRLDCNKTPDQVYDSVKDALKLRGFEVNNVPN